MARDIGPMPGKDPPAVGVLLALPHNSHTGALEAEVESANSGEERANGQHPAPSPACAATGNTPASRRSGQKHGPSAPNRFAPQSVHRPIVGGTSPISSLDGLSRCLRPPCGPPMSSPPARPSSRIGGLLRHLRRPEALVAPVAPAEPGPAREQLDAADIGRP